MVTFSLPTAPGNINDLERMLVVIEAPLKQATTRSGLAPSKGGSMLHPLWPCTDSSWTTVPGQVGQGPSSTTWPPRLTLRWQHSLSPGQAGMTPQTPPIGLSRQARTGVSTNTGTDSMKFRNRSIMKDFFPTRVGQVHTSGEIQSNFKSTNHKARVEHTGCASALPPASGMRLVCGPQQGPSGDWWMGGH